MRAVTRDVDPELAARLAAAGERGAVALAGAAGPEVAPACATCLADGSWRLVLLDRLDAPPVPGTEAVVLVDAGTDWYDLRAGYVRGVLTEVGERSLSLAARRSLAWDYGQLREVDPAAVAPARVDAPGSVDVPGGVDGSAAAAGAAVPRAAAAGTATTGPAGGLRRPAAPGWWRVVRRARVARIATVSASGRPSVNPLYHSLHRGRIWLGTPAWTLAARNVIADPRVSLLFEVEGAEGPLVRVTGTATVRTDRVAIATFDLLALGKYVLRLHNVRNVWAHRRQVPLKRVYHQQSRARGPSAVIVVEPTRIELVAR